MTARILIVDSVATKRIVLKVKLQSAHYRVTACATRAEAEAAITRQRPDLILFNPVGDAENLNAFCRDLRKASNTEGIAIIASGQDDTAKARFAALDAGADDVLPHPVEDALLLARVRSLLRIKSAGQEFSLRESTSRALGFGDARQAFTRAAKLAYIATDDGPPADAIAALARLPGHALETCQLSDILENRKAPRAPDTVILDLGRRSQAQAARFDLISELRARATTRMVAVLVIVPKCAQAEAAMYLDLGADDVVFDDVRGDELALRAKGLVARKLQQDGLRATVRDGLHAALTDPLTGLYNRRYVMPHLARMAEEAVASQRPFAVMMLDIDHFKTVNDAHGHAAGDAVLRAIAARLRENLRAIDLVGRIGGEEFLVAMPQTSARQAKLAADRLRRVIGNLPFVLDDGETLLAVSVSVGVAVSGAGDLPPQPLNQLCRGADKALYRAKTAGRNQVAMALSAA